MPRQRMKTRFFDQLLGGADEWLRPWAMAVDPSPEGEGEGGGGDLVDDDDEGDLGETGIKTLREERARRKQLDRELAQLRAQLDQVKGLNPDTYAEAQRRADELQRELQRKDQDLSEVQRRIETKANERVTKAEQRAQNAERESIDLQTRTLAAGVFAACRGKDGADESGLSFFDAWFAFHGSRHLKLDPGTKKLRAVDSDGDPIKGADGLDVDPIKWVDEQADRSPVVGNFFKPKGGVGSGGLTGARGVRGVQGMSPEEIKKLDPSQKMALHRQSRAA